MLGDAVLDIKLETLSMVILLEDIVVVVMASVLLAVLLIPVCVIL